MRTKYELLVSLSRFILLTFTLISPLVYSFNSDTESSLTSLTGTTNLHTETVRSTTDSLIEPTASVQNPAQTQTAFTNIYFSRSAGHFSYSDDVFRGTAEPYYANGKYINNSQCDNNGCLKTSFGGRDNETITGMSGGWTTSFNVPRTADITLTLRYRIRQLRDFEPNEYTEALVSLDGELVGLAGKDYLRRVRGDGNGGENIDTGWRSATLDLGRVSNGAHTLTVGGFSNKKTARKEYATVWFDTISLSSLTAGNSNSSEDDDVRFGVLGDFGTDTEEHEDVANEMSTWELDFIITVGDNRYGNRSMDDVIGQYYCGFLADVNGGRYCRNGTSNVNAFFPSPGNHDYGDGAGIGEYLDYFTLPGSNIETTGTSGTELYYDFIQGPVHFFAIDSEGSRFTSQKAWLKRGLEASTSPWKVVFFHHPPYSSSSYHGSNTNMQWPFSEWGADVVIGGHDHTYERIERDGVIYFVNGLGGRSLYRMGNPLPGSRVRYNGDNGAQRITATPTRMKFEFITRTGVIVDSRSIFK
ncbi:MAG: metallophosphoesterase [Granulosicoccus sp.]